MINQLWKLIPMKEKEENWQLHLETTIEEMNGLIQLNPNTKGIGISLIAKLSGLREEICPSFSIYRKTIFECIDLLGKVIEDD